MAFGKKKPKPSGLEIDLTDERGMLTLAMNMAGGITDPLQRVAAKCLIAMTHYHLADKDGAKALIQGCIDDAYRIPDPQMMGSALFYISEALGEIDEVDAATQHLDKGLSCMEFIETAAWSSRGYRKIAEAIAKRGETEKNIQLLQQAYQIAEKILDTPYKVAAYCSIAKGLASIGEIEYSLRVMAAARDSAAHADETSRPIVYQTLARGFNDIGDETTAMQMAKIAYDVSISVLNPTLKAIALSKCAFMLSLLGAENECKDTLSLALSTAYSVQDDPGKIASLSVMAGELGKMEMYTDAQKMLQHVIQIHAGLLGIREKNNAIYNIVEAICEILSYPDAVKTDIKRWEKAITLLEEKVAQNEATACIAKAKEEYKSGKYGDAVKMVSMARRIILSAIYQRQKLVEELRVRLESMETNLLMFHEAQLETKEYEELLGECKDLMREKDYPAVKEVLSELEGMAEKLHALMSPDVDIQFDQCNFIANAWSKVMIKAKNIGHGRARKVKISIDGPIDLQGDPIFEDLQSGAEKSITCPMLPKEAGNLLIKITITMEGAGGTINIKKKEMWIDVAQPASKQAQSVQNIPQMAPMPQVTTGEVVSPRPEPRAIDPQTEIWRKETATMKRFTLEFDDVPMPGELVFDTISDILIEDGFFPIAPKTTTAHGFFRGMARFSRHEGSERIFFEVMSGGGKSKVILRAFDTNNPEGTAERILSELSLRIDIEQYRRRGTPPPEGNPQGDNKG